MEMLKVIFRSTNPKMLQKARMTNRIMGILRKKFGGKFYVMSLGIDIEPNEVRAKVA